MNESLKILVFIHSEYTRRQGSIAKLGTVTPTCNSRTQETESREFKSFPNEFKTFLYYI